MIVKRFTSVVIILILLLISLILTMPARVAYQYLANPIIVEGIQGKLLTGSAKTIIFRQHKPFASTQEIVNLKIKNIQWKWQPLDLIYAKLSFYYQVDDSNIKGTGYISKNLMGEVEIHHNEINISSEIINPFLPNGNQFNGQIKIIIDSAFIQNNKLNQIKSTLTTEKLALKSMIGQFKFHHNQLELISKTSNHYELTLFNINDKLKNNRPESFIKSIIMSNVSSNNIRLSGNVKSGTALFNDFNPFLPLIAKKINNNWIVNWKGNLPAIQ